MSKKLLFSIVAVLVIIVICFVYFYMNKQTGNNINNNRAATTPSVTAKMPETNPFKTKVNPMQGYTNPFSK